MNISLTQCQICFNNVHLLRIIFLLFGNFDHDSAISCKSGEATFGLCCISLYKGTLVNPAQFHQLQNSGSRNQSLNANQPNVSITNFR